MEAWKSVPGFSNYEVSCLGNLRHVKFKRLRRGCITKRGYMQDTMIGDDGCVKTISRHRLVILTFQGPIAENLEVDHINRDCLDNKLDNLRVVTKDKNRENSSRHPAKADTKRMALLLEVVELYNSGKSLEEIYDIIYKKQPN